MVEVISKRGVHMNTLSLRRKETHFFTASWSPYFLRRRTRLYPTPAAERRHNLAPDVSPGSTSNRGIKSRRDDTRLDRKSKIPALSLPRTDTGNRGHRKPRK